MKQILFSMFAMLMTVSSSFAQVKGNTLSFQAAHDVKANKIKIYVTETSSALGAQMHSEVIGSEKGYTPEDLKNRINSVVDRLEHHILVKTGQKYLLDLTGLGVALYGLRVTYAGSELEELWVKLSYNTDHELTYMKVPKYKSGQIVGAFLVLGTGAFLCHKLNGQLGESQSARTVLIQIVDHLANNQPLSLSDAEIAQAKSALVEILN